MESTSAHLLTDLLACFLTYSLTYYYSASRTTCRRASWAIRRTSPSTGAADTLLIHVHSARRPASTSTRKQWNVARGTWCVARGTWYVVRLSVARVDCVQLDSSHAGEWARVGRAARCGSLHIRWLVARLVRCRHRVGQRARWA